MKVKLAAQVFSSSVANALLFCEDLGLPEFKGCKATASFILTIDQVFDALNSMHPNAKGQKAPLSSHNKQYWQSLFKRAETQLLSLESKVSGTTIPVHESRRRTAVVGLVCTMRSVSGILSELVTCSEPKLKYLLTYKLSQDHLETFFSTLRSIMGSNTNPKCCSAKFRNEENIDCKDSTANKWELYSTG
jgi:hypothetical protein